MARDRVGNSGMMVILWIAVIFALGLLLTQLGFNQLEPFIPSLIILFMGIFLAGQAGYSLKKFTRIPKVRNIKILSLIIGIIAVLISISGLLTAIGTNVPIPFLTEVMYKWINVAILIGFIAELTIIK